jgi:hypothetical protein
MDCDQSICDATSRKAKLYKYLSCGCRRICSCKEAKSDEEYDDSSKQSQSGTVCYWSPYPTWTWVPFWFENSDKAAEYPVTYRREMEVAHKKTIESEGVGKHVFPTQSRRVQHNEIAPVPNALVLPPCYGIVGHPSLKIYRFQLPGHLHPLLDHIVEGCANYANSLPSGWR